MRRRINRFTWLEPRSLRFCGPCTEVWLEPTQLELWPHWDDDGEELPDRAPVLEAGSQRPNGVGICASWPKSSLRALQDERRSRLVR